MKTLKMEVWMLPSGKNQKKIKIKKTFAGHFPGLIWHIFLGTMEASFHEWKIRTSWFWEYLKKNIELERHVLESEIRIVVLIFLNLIALGWLINQRVLVFSLPYNYAFGEEISDLKLPIIPDENPDLAGIARLDSERNSNDENSNDENRSIIIELNKLISSQDEKCQKDKNDERCTELCIKNEEEIIAQMKEEEKQAWLKYLASRPKLMTRSTGWVSCAEKDDGDPSKSKTKGKHRDEDCCPDPDEWPKPGCRYSAHGLALMLKGPKK